MDPRLIILSKYAYLTYKFFISWLFTLEYNGYVLKDDVTNFCLFRNCEVITVIKDDGNSKPPIEEIGIDSRDDRKQFFCVNCDKAYSRQSALNKHLREAHNIKDTKHEMQVSAKI